MDTFILTYKRYKRLKYTRKFDNEKNSCNNRNDSINKKRFSIDIFLMKSRRFYFPITKDFFNNKIFFFAKVSFFEYNKLFYFLFILLN